MASKTRVKTAAKPAANVGLPVPAKKDSGLLSALCYLAGFLGGASFLVQVVIYILSKDDRFVRFHALQALVFDVSLMLAGILLYACALVFVIVFWIGGISLMVLLAALGSQLGFLAALAPLLFPVIWVTVMVVAVVVIIGVIGTHLYMAYTSFKERTVLLPRIGKFVLKYV